MTDISSWLNNSFILIKRWIKTFEGEFAKSKGRFMSANRSKSMENKNVWSLKLASVYISTDVLFKMGESIIFRTDKNIWLFHKMTFEFSRL